jgi:hypothetical protein
MTCDSNDNEVGLFYVNTKTSKAGLTQKQLETRNRPCVIRDTCCL